METKLLFSLKLRAVYYIFSFFMSQLLFLLGKMAFVMKVNVGES